MWNASGIFAACWTRRPLPRGAAENRRALLPLRVSRRPAMTRRPHRRYAARKERTMGIGLEILIVLLLIILRGLSALSELALVSARRARLAVLERKGIKGATRARELAGDPQRFLPTVQVGITLVAML